MNDNTIMPGFQTQEYFDSEIAKHKAEAAGLAAMLAQAREEIADLKKTNEVQIGRYVRAITFQRNMALDHAADLLMQLELLREEVARK